MICCVMKAAVMEGPLLKNLSLLYKVCVVKHDSAHRQ